MRSDEEIKCHNCRHSFMDEQYLTLRKCNPAGNTFLEQIAVKPCEHFAHKVIENKTRERKS